MVCFTGAGAVWIAWVQKNLKPENGSESQRLMRGLLGAFYQSHNANLKYQTAKNRYSNQVFQIFRVLPRLNVP